MNSDEYFFDQDGDCHWYLVPEIHREAWDKWRDIDPRDEKSWDVPEFALTLGQHPRFFVFKEVRNV